MPPKLAPEERVSACEGSLLLRGIRCSVHDEHVAYVASASDNSRCSKNGCLFTIELNEIRRTFRLGLDLERRTLLLFSTKRIIHQKRHHGDCRAPAINSRQRFYRNVITALNPAASIFQEQEVAVWEVSLPIGRLSSFFRYPARLCHRAAELNF